jgi:hypothetical protein
MSNLIDLQEFKKSKEKEPEELNEELNFDNPAFFSGGYLLGIQEGMRLERKKINSLIYLLFFINFILLLIINFLLINQY